MKKIELNSLPPFPLKLQVFKIGDDFLFLITGGMAHIGAVSLSFLKNGAHSVSSAIYPPHKEADLFTKISLFLSKTLKTTVVVTGGIHWDFLKKEDITVISKTAFELCKQASEQLDTESP